MKTVLIVPTWDREDMLERCVETARTHAKVDDVIVVRKMSPTASARNYGIAKAPSGSVIFSVDDDCWYDGEIHLDEAVDLALRPVTGIVQTTRWMRGKPLLPDERRAHSKVVLAWMGAGIVFRKQVWENVGGYPDDYLDDIMFSAKVYGSGLQNYRSTRCYGHHDVDTKHGGMQAVLNELGSAGVNQCHPELYGVVGEPCMSKGGKIPNIKNIRPSHELLSRHKENRCRG